ncbi:SDR family NAD(P)-dependent oxidoreductase [Actinocorallia sp. A-T 12471]|uniref:SDR family NAD(P)-dependent oxidoreductase n=1 Tax=Actinocorallia sp. A-T 12471 TaxID=3089813 RepID=UPI0029CCDCCA|nr:SDR family NAD(P)-dependent oxidoreductase [Actinocorallia sp. A-T 12471]MDX6740997.1 SDR family NAD(P)-dependent oxidoreductase [Actinocorallia sp. A-T 12471]
MRELRDRVAVVTGAGSGIGRALALRFADEGMDVAVTDIDGAALTSTAEAVASRGVRTVTHVADVGEHAEVEAFADLVYAELGAVHLLCNNAGVYMGGQTWTRPAADFAWTLRVNLWGILHGLNAFIPRMLDGGEEGHVVNTCSVAGLFVGPGAAPYTISKWAAFAATLSLAQELALTGAPIGVSALCPGGVTTRIHESERARPASLPYTPGDDAAFMQTMIEQTVANGIPPESVADHVISAIHTRRFLILTHPAYANGLPAQATTLLTGTLPTLPNFEQQA